MIYSDFFFNLMQFWNCPESLVSSEKTRTALKTSRKFGIIWNYPYSFETVWIILITCGSFESRPKKLKSSGNIWTCLKFFLNFFCFHVYFDINQRPDFTIRLVFVFSLIYEFIIELIFETNTIQNFPFRRDSNYIISLRSLIYGQCENVMKYFF